MSIENTFLGRITGHLTTAILPLKEAVATPGSFDKLLRELGWFGGAIPSYVGENLASAIDEVITAFDNLPIEPQESDAIQLLTKVANVYQQIKVNMTDIVASIDFGDLAGTFITETPRAIINLLIVKYLSKQFPTLYSSLLLAGVIKSEYVTAITGRPAYYKNTLDYTKLGGFISTPETALQEFSGWNTSAYNPETLVAAFLNLFAGIGLPAMYMPTPVADIEKYKTTFGSYQSAKMLKVNMATVTIDDESTSLGFRIAEAKGGNLANTGFILDLIFPSGLSATHEIASDLSLILSGAYSTGVPAVLVTPSTVDVRILEQTSSDLRIKAGLRYTPTTAKSLIGKADGTRLQIKGGTISFEGIKNANEQELIIEADLSGLQFVFDPGDGDGFINKVSGDGKRTVNLPLVVIWSSKHGIRFRGSSGFEITTNPQKRIGPLKFEQLSLALLPSVLFGPVKLEVGATISGDLGFLAFRVENMGMALAFKGEEGNAGPFDINLGFKPPNGVGLQVNAKGVQGGGYVYFDKDKGRYMGALELNIMDKIHVTAVGIITTKAPDGSSGFSLLILASATFPGVPIGFGFTLNGVGAVGAANRRVEDNSLREGIRSGSIYNLMFPSNVVENINGIITDLEGIFPLQQNQYTFGAFFLLKWGVGIPLIDVKMGVILTLPNPVKITIIGTIRVALPKPEVPVLLLNVAFIGVIDLDNKYIAFDADIFDSRILMLTLSGTMALRIFWGQRKEMLLSVGGFHPAYRAPGWLKLPQRMNRITISLFDQDNLRLTVATYFAVTSNTVQFGVALDFLFNVWKVSIVGRFGFDVLFQFNPFRFMAHVYAYLGVLFDGREIMSISLDFSLDGPGPWHAVGRAEFEVMKVRVSANFDKTWGEKPDTSVPEVEVRPMLVADLNKDENWQGTFPDKKRQLVKLNAGASETLLMDPVGDFTISQKALPLDVKVERYGGQKAKDADVYAISGIKIATQAVPVQKVQKVQENFAPAQFRDMDDKKKLEATPFEYLSSGRKVMYDASDIELGDFMVMDVDYDCVIIDAQTRTFKAGEVLSTELVNNFILGGAIGSNAVSKQLRAAAVNPIAKVSMVQEGFQIKSKDSLKDAQTIKTGIKSSASSLAEALTEKDRWESLYAGRFEVMPVY